MSIPGLAKFKFPHGDWTQPTKANSTDIGYDLVTRSVDEDSETKIVKITLGVAVKPPPGTFFMLFARSSLYKSGYALANSVGIIDPNYQDELMAMLFPIVAKPKKLKTHERYVQLVPINIVPCGWANQNDFDEESRGGGFGSSGKTAIKETKDLEKKGSKKGSKKKAEENSDAEEEEAEETDSKPKKPKKSSKKSSKKAVKESSDAEEEAEEEVETKPKPKKPKKSSKKATKESSDAEEEEVEEDIKAKAKKPKKSSKKAVKESSDAEEEAEEEVKPKKPKKESTKGSKKKSKKVESESEED